MVRTQIYLPEETHSNLLRMAKEKGTTLSKLIRDSADITLKKHYGELTPKERALRFFGNPNKKYRLNLTGAELTDLIRKDRDS